MESEVEEGVILKGGIGVGNFIDVGIVESVDLCMWFCCVFEKCNLVLVIKGYCFFVVCFSKELCKIVKFEIKNYWFIVVFVWRWIINVIEDIGM